MQPQEQFEDLEEYIYQLQRIARWLRLLGLVILSTTLFNLGVVGAAAVRILPPSIGLQMSSILFVSAVLLAMMFEQLRRRGEVIYGEVTDELHRTHNEPHLERPRISFRIALKNFASSMELPLIPGRFGASLYLLLDLGALLFAFSAYRLY